MQHVAELTISLRMRRQTVAVAAVAAPPSPAVVVNCQLAALLGFMQIAAALAMASVPGGEPLLPMTMTTAQRQLWLQLQLQLLNCSARVAVGV